MRERKRLMVLLAAGVLALGPGVAFAGSSDSSKAPEGAKATQVSSSPASKESKASESTKYFKEKGVKAERAVRGEVTAVESSANPPTLTLKVMRGKQEEAIGVDVPSGVKIREGKATKTLADVKVGDRVWMRYDHTKDRLVAEQIRILKPAQMAAKSKSE